MFDELQEHFEKLKRQESYIEFFNELALRKLRSNPEFVKKLMEGILSISRDYNYLIAYASALNYLGWYYHDRADYNKATELHTESNEIFLKNDSMEGAVKSYNALLADYTQMGVFDLAIEYGIKGITIAEKYGIEEGLGNLMVNTVVAYVQCHYYDKALELIKRLELIPYDMSDNSRIVMYTSRIEIELHYNNIYGAFNYYKIAYDMAEKLQYKSHIAELLVIRSKIQCRIACYDEAERSLEKALAISEEARDLSIYVSALIEWAKLNIKFEKYEEGKNKLKIALSLAEEASLNNLVVEIYNELSMLYKNLGQYQEGFEALEKYCMYNKNMFNKNSGVWFAKFNNKKLEQDAAIYRELYNEMDFISRLGKKLTSDLKLESILDTVYHELNKLIKADVFGIALYKEKEEILDYELFVDSGEKDNLGSVSIHSKKSFGPYCFKHKVDFKINDVEKEYKKYAPEFDIIKDRLKKKRAISLIYCPLIIDDKATGIISVQSYDKNAYTLSDLNTVRTLSAYLAIAVENAKLFSETKYLASHDNLTGALNRRELIKSGEASYEDMRKNDKEMCLIMIDIDHFKDVNDTYGHIVGDYVLKEVIKITTKNIGENHIVGRYGGEEFLISLPDTSVDECIAIAEKIREEIENYNFSIGEARNIKITASFGVYGFNMPLISFYGGINCADIALYNAKKTGRNKTVCYTNNLK